MPRSPINLCQNVIKSVFVAIREERNKFGLPFLFTLFREALGDEMQKKRV